MCWEGYLLLLVRLYCNDFVHIGLYQLACFRWSSSHTITSTTNQAERCVCLCKGREWLFNLWICRRSLPTLTTPSVFSVSPWCGFWIDQNWLQVIIAVNLLRRKTASQKHGPERFFLNHGKTYFSVRPSFVYLRKIVSWFDCTAVAMKNARDGKPASEL